MNKTQYLIMALSLALVLTACETIDIPEEGPPAVGANCPFDEDTVASEKPHVTLMLDWVPNTNHTGIYFADSEDYFDDIENCSYLDVNIVQPGEVFAEQAVASGAADFGISFQEAVTLARAEGAPIVSIAAIIQHNTSGFAALSETGIESPADFEGLTYGSFGSPFEKPTIEGLMNCVGADPSQVEIVDIGFSDPLALLAEDQIDLAWIFQGWQGAQASFYGLDIDVVMMEDYFDCIPDYYTPVIITNESTIANRPDIVRQFLLAVSRGYEFAIQDPEYAVLSLLPNAQELNATLAVESQKWLSPRYQADASQWGIQDRAVWQAYTDWMVANGVLDEAIDVDAAFTNDFLP